MTRPGIGRVMQVTIPDKLYFKIGEVARLTGVKPHVLRYWESEFQNIRPVKSQGKQRLYRREDIEFILQLKDMLHQQGYTIAGARKILAQKCRSLQPPVDQPLDAMRMLRDIREDLLRLRTLLDRT